MLYLSGAVVQTAIGMPGLGFILTPNMRNAVPGAGPWAADNGCYTDKVPFDLDRYLEWLAQRRQWSDRCLFATAPDVWADSAATRLRGWHVLAQIRTLGFKAAYCAQDGIADERMDWDRLDALFVGGSNPFRVAESTYALVRAAKQQGKWVHLGRVNSERRLRAAALAGYDSVDGTHIAFAPTAGIAEVRQWLAHLDAQPFLLEMDNAEDTR